MQICVMRFGTLAAASTIALTVAFKASGAEVVDSINNYNIINENLSYYCISNKDSDVLKCTAAQMESAEALSTGLKKFLEAKKLFTPLERQGLDKSCSDSFAAVKQNFLSSQSLNGYEYAVREYFTAGFMASEECVQAIGNISANNGYDYMPSVRNLLTGMVRSAEKGNLVRGYSI